jgi:hypothetical protein
MSIGYPKIQTEKRVKLTNTGKNAPVVAVKIHSRLNQIGPPVFLNRKQEGRGISDLRRSY